MFASSALEDTWTTVVQHKLVPSDVSPTNSPVTLSTSFNKRFIERGG